MGKNSNLNHSQFTVPFVSLMIETLLKHLADHQSEMQSMNQASLVENLMRVLHEFLLVKVKENSLDSNEVPSVSMFYLSDERRDLTPYGYQDEASLILENFEKNSLSPE